MKSMDGGPGGQAINSSLVIASPMDLERLKRQQLDALEQKQLLKEGLPYLYGQKHYPWTRRFFESRNRECLITAANQVGKSTIQIRRWIHWATSPQLWPSLWPAHPKPNLFWYLYPTKDVATQEFETKWLPLLPQVKFKDHPVYGWEENYENKKIHSIRFNSGIVGYFRTYAQDVQHLQSGTVFYIGADEELPADLYDELKKRLSATRGYFSLVFTATLGQEFWRLVMEEKNPKYEKMPHADKQQISLYDCQFFEDGTPSHWTPEVIQDEVDSCSTDDEVQRRVFGKFVVTQGRIFSSFTIKENVQRQGPVPKDWFVYWGIDNGSGGLQGHPAAICAVAVSPDFTRGRVCCAWRGDKIVTAAGDVVLKYQELKKYVTEELGLRTISARYDSQAKDLEIIATRLTEPLEKAEKAQETGYGIVNTLFRTGMVTLDEGDPEIMKLAYELSSVLISTSKTKAKDDLADAFRFAVVLIPWNFTIIKGPLKLPLTMKATAAMTQEERMTEEVRARRAEMFDQPKEISNVQSEIDSWNELY